MPAPADFAASAVPLPPQGMAATQQSTMTRGTSGFALARQALPSPLRRWCLSLTDKPPRRAALPRTPCVFAREAQEPRCPERTSEPAFPGIRARRRTLARGTPRGLPDFQTYEFHFFRVEFDRRWLEGGNMAAACLLFLALCCSVDAIEIRGPPSATLLRHNMPILVGSMGLRGGGEQQEPSKRRTRPDMRGRGGHAGLGMWLRALAKRWLPAGCLPWAPRQSKEQKRAARRESYLAYRAVKRKRDKAQRMAQHHALPTLPAPAGPKEPSAHVPRCRKTAQRRKACGDVSRGTGG